MSSLPGCHVNLRLPSEQTAQVLGQTGFLGKFLQFISIDLSIKPPNYLYFVLSCIFVFSAFKVLRDRQRLGELIFYLSASCYCLSFESFRLLPVARQFF